MIFLRRSNKYFANSEKSNTFAILNQKVYLQCLFQTWQQATEKHTSPDGGIGRRAGLKHQWSNPCRFDPGSGYQTKCKCLNIKHLHFSFSFLHHGCTTKKDGTLFMPTLHHYLPSKFNSIFKIDYLCFQHRK